MAEHSLLYHLITSTPKYFDNDNARLTSYRSQIEIVHWSLVPLSKITLPAPPGVSAQVEDGRQWICRCFMGCVIPVNYLWPRGEFTQTMNQNLLNATGRAATYVPTAGLMQSRSCLMMLVHTYY